MNKAKSEERRIACVLCEQKVNDHEERIGDMEIALYGKKNDPEGKSLINTVDTMSKILNWILGMAAASFVTLLITTITLAFNVGAWVKQINTNTKHIENNMNKVSISNEEININGKIRIYE